MVILAKVSLAKAAVKLISAGQIIFLDGGTTNAQLARHLPHEIALTVVTHSPSIAVELANHPLVQVEIIGGRLFKHSVVAMGATTLDAIENVRIDAYFMGVTGLHPDTGATTGDHEEAALKRRICRQSSETVKLSLLSCKRATVYSLSIFFSLAALRSLVFSLSPLTRFSSRPVAISFSVSKSFLAGGRLVLLES